MMPPTASSVTVDDPEMAANRAQESTVATARPPGTGALAALTRRTRRSAMEPRVMIWPARRNRGMESRISLFNACQASRMTNRNGSSPNTR